MLGRSQWGQAGGGFLEGLKLAQQEKQTETQLAAQLAMMDRQATAEERQAAALRRQVSNDANKNFQDWIKNVDTNPVEALELLSQANPSDLGVTPENYLLLRGRATKLAPVYQRYGQLQARGISDQLTEQDLTDPANVAALQRFAGDNAFKYTEGIRMRGRNDAIRDVESGVRLKVEPMKLLAHLSQRFPNINEAVTIMERLDPAYAAEFKKTMEAAAAEGGLRGKATTLADKTVSDALSKHEGNVSQQTALGRAVGDALAYRQPGVAPALQDRQFDEKKAGQAGTYAATNELGPNTRAARKIDSETALNDARAAVLNLMQEEQAADKNWANIRRSAQVLEDVIQSQQNIAIFRDFMAKRGEKVPDDLFGYVRNMATEATKRLAEAQKQPQRKAPNKKERITVTRDAQGNLIRKTE